MVCVCNWYVCNGMYVNGMYVMCVYVILFIYLSILVYICSMSE